MFAQFKKCKYDIVAKKIEQIVTKPNLEFLYQLLKVVWHFIDMFSIRVWSMKLFNLKTLVVQSTLKVNVKQANVCTNGNAVGWLNKYVCRGGKNTICFLPTYLSSNMQSRPKRNSSSTQEKYFGSTLTFCFYRTLVRLLSTLVKNSLTDSFMCLRIKWRDPGDNYAK